MKISSKARYGLAALVSMTQNPDSEACTKLISLSENLRISKIYLEQVFSLLKRGGIITSTKGSQGGYHLSRAAKEISVFEILSSIETTIFEKTENTVDESDESIERAMQEIVFDIIDNSLKDILTNISLDDIAKKAKSLKDAQGYMYYI